MFEDENGNRPGDWMHKNQRTKESVNRIIKDPNAKKWYQETFWPAGVILAWRSDWPLAVKIIVSVLVAIYVAIAYMTLTQAPSA